MASVARTPRLPAMPQGDPAGGGRHNPSPRTKNVARTAEANPFVPDMRKDSSEVKGRDPENYAFNASVGSEVSIRPSSAGSFRPSASGSSPRHNMSAAAELKAKGKRLERLHDLYQTSFSRETLLSEQYGKELQQVREHLQEVLLSGQSCKEAVTGRDERARKTKARQTKRIATMESKLSGLEAYNEQLVAAVNNLRMQNAPNRQAFSKLAADRQNSMVKVARLGSAPSSPPVPPQRAPGGSGRLGTPRAEVRPPGAPPPPPVLERAASKVAHVAAFDRAAV